MASPAKYTYHRLVNHKTQIRLLSSQPHFKKDTNSEVLHFTLQVYDLEAAPEYIALSYVWGDGKADRSITIDGEPFFVRQGLASFMKMFVGVYPGKSIWIDAICINQVDNQEKSAQVGIMHKIYERAGETLIWLGDETPQLRHAFESVQKIRDAAFPQSPTPTQEPFDIESNKPLNVQHCFDDRTRQSLTDLVSNAWFERVWVIQECFYARHAFLCCSEMRLPWTSFMRASMAILDVDNYTWHEDQLEQRLAHLPFVRLYSQRTMYIIRETWHHLRLGQTKPRSDLFTLLSGLFHHQTDSHTSTDPRDRVYALLNMASDLDELSLIPDYFRSCAQIYEDVVTAYLKQGHYNILCWSNGKHSDLSVPSWAIDWMKPLSWPLRPNELTVDLPSVTFRFRAGISAEALSSAHKPTSNGKGVLSCRSHNIDQIRHFTVLGKFRSSTCEEFLESMAPVAQWMASVMIRGRVYGHERSNRGKIEAGYFTSIAGQTCVDEIIEKADMTYCSEFVDALKVYRDIKDAKVAELPDWVYESEYLASIRNGRALFITETGLCGLGPKDVTKGDEVHVILGCDMPMVLRGCEDKDNTFKLVGECYMHGLMFGAALKRSLDVEDIEII